MCLEGHNVIAENAITAGRKGKTRRIKAAARQQPLPAGSDSRPENTIKAYALFLFTIYQPGIINRVIHSV